MLIEDVIVDAYWFNAVLDLHVFWGYERIQWKTSNMLQIGNVLNKMMSLKIHYQMIDLGMWSSFAKEPNNELQIIIDELRNLSYSIWNGKQKIQKLE